MKMKLVACVLLVADVRAQLRPRRVGINPLGESEAADADFNEEAILAKLQAMKAQAAGEDAGLGGSMADQMAMLQKMMSGDGSMTETLQAMMKENPMMKSLMASNPEMAEVFENPEKLQESLAAVQEMMTSPEGMSGALRMGERPRITAPGPLAWAVALRAFPIRRLLRA